MNSAARRETWEKCWAQGKYVPDYFSPGEYEQFVALRSRVYARHLAGFEEVSEFGCGTGHNLLALKGHVERLRGFDWATSAVDHVRGLGIEAEFFDMFDPDYSVELNGAVLTVHAMEQLGESWREFLAYLFCKDIGIVVHIEPIAELYDESARDQERLAYHRKRGYLVGYLTELRALEKCGEIELIEVTKSPFGGKDHDAYSVVVWRPL